MTKLNSWLVEYRDGPGQWEGPLVAYWEAERDAISDDYTPAEVTAEDLLRRWAQQVSARYPNGLIPIHWFVESREAGKFSAMPFAYDHFGGAFEIESFLDLYRWPVHSATRERLNWFDLPVIDKRWNSRESATGGFIQEATGWKPSLLQPFVYLPALLQTQPHG